MLKRTLLFLIAIVFCSFSYAQKDSISNSKKKKSEFTYWDYLHYYSSVKDTDTANLVKIPKEIINDTKPKRDSLKYPVSDFNYTIIKVSKSADDKNYIIRKKNSNWLPLLILATLIYYVILRRIFSKSFPVIFQSYWNDRMIHQLARDDNFFKMRTAVSLFILYSLIFSLFLYNLSNYIGWLPTYQGMDKYIFILNVILVFYILKYLISKLISFMFSFQRLMSAHLAIISVSNLVYILLIAPFLVFYQFLPPAMLPYVIIALTLVFVFNSFYKYIRSSVFALNNFQFSKFYLFVYLCTLEIVPVLVIIKLILVS